MSSQDRADHELWFMIGAVFGPVDHDRRDHELWFMIGAIMAGVVAAVFTATATIDDHDRRL